MRKKTVSEAGRTDPKGPGSQPLPSPGNTVLEQLHLASTPNLVPPQGVACLLTTTHSLQSEFFFPSKRKYITKLLTFLGFCLFCLQLKRSKQEDSVSVSLSLSNQTQKEAGKVKHECQWQVGSFQVHNLLKLGSLHFTGKKNRLLTIGFSPLEMGEGRNKPELQREHKTGSRGPSCSLSSPLPMTLTRIY